MKRDKFKSLGRTQLSSNPGRTINQRFSYTSLLWKNLPLIVQCRFRSAVYKTEHVGLIANILHWYEVKMASHSRNLRWLLRICMKNWMDRQFHREIVNYRAKVLSNIWFSLTSKSDKRFFPNDGYIPLLANADNLVQYLNSWPFPSFSFAVF